MVPRCEPSPAKALVVLDALNDLPPALQGQPGVVVRSTRQQLETDISLKLRVANGTHTAIAHTLALLKHLQTDVLSSPQGSLFMKFLDSLVQQQIIPATTSISSQQEAAAVWEDWRKRLVHPHFGLSSFFITQNGTAKGGIRWGPTVTELISSDRSTTAAMAFAYAALLRWLTPMPSSSDAYGIYTGWFDGSDPQDVADEQADTAKDTVVYGDGMLHSFKQGWYEYQCTLTVPKEYDNDKSSNGDGTIALPMLLQQCIGKLPNKCVVAVRAYLLASMGGDLESCASKPEFENLVHAIACLYSRMVGNGGAASIMSILTELESKSMGGLVGFDTPCSAMMDYYMYLSGI